MGQHSLEICNIATRGCMKITVMCHPLPAHCHRYQSPHLPRATHPTVIYFFLIIIAMIIIQAITAVLVNITSTARSTSTIVYNCYITPRLCTNEWRMEEVVVRCIANWHRQVPQLRRIKWGFDSVSDHLVLSLFVMMSALSSLKL